MAEEDPTRVWQPTKASEAARADAIAQRKIRQAMPTVGVGHLSDDKITADRRWRLMQALKAAGLEV